MQFDSQISNAISNKLNYKLFAFRRVITSHNHRGLSC